MKEKDWATIGKVMAELKDVLKEMVDKRIEAETKLTAQSAVVEVGKRIHYRLGHYRQSRGEKDYQQLRLADELLGEALDKLQDGDGE